MPDLAPLTAFGRAAPRRQRFGPVVLAETVGGGLASLALSRGAPVPRLRDLMLPGPGCWARGAAAAAFWIAPDQWMIEVAGGADADLEQDLGAAVPGAAVATQTDGWVVLEITSEAGPGLLGRILEKLVNLDPIHLAPGCATRTLIEHMSVFVIRRSPTVVAVLGMRSAAGSLWHRLEDTLARATDGQR